MNHADLVKKLSADFEAHFKRGTPTMHELQLLVYGFIVGRDASAELVEQYAKIEAVNLIGNRIRRLGKK